MNDIQIFKNPDFGEVRTLSIDGEPWFVAANVCKALCIANSRDAVARLDGDEKGVALTDTPVGAQDVVTVNGPGLYTLVLSSRKPEAKTFKRWITHEVIPAIRKSGGYIAGQESMTPEELMAKALTVAQRTLAEREARISQLSTQAAIMAPKADYSLADLNTADVLNLGLGPVSFDRIEKLIESGEVVTSPGDDGRLHVKWAKKNTQYNPASGTKYDPYGLLK